MRATGLRRAGARAAAALAMPAIRRPAAARCAPLSRSMSNPVSREATWEPSAPVAEGEIPSPLSQINKSVLDDLKFKQLVTEDLWTKLLHLRETGEPLSKVEANELALAVRKWAQSHGCVSYSHWFSPIRGAVHGENMYSFVGVDKSGKMILDLSGAELFQTETDGSSFPNGGLRTTHQAAAYTSWDTTSPPFVYGDTLYLPSTFVAWTGNSLDMKVPLLRSNAAVNTHATRVLRHLGDKQTTKVVANVGWEQEFFIIDRDVFRNRPDIVGTGRALFGRLPEKGQEQSSNYFGRINPRTRALMRDVRDRLWELGVPIHCIHNEVAPGQHEFSPIFSLAQHSADTNVLAMEVLSDACQEHDLAVLYHEKPFAGINGSGKHNNWGLNTTSNGATTGNCFTPGKTETEQRRFITFLAALMRAMHVHGDLLRVGVSTAGNDHRLGAQEAPPAILTLYLGKSLEQFMREIASGSNDKSIAGFNSTSRTMPIAPGVASVNSALEDRNRTAPFPWCGNRFEFRACGSAQHLAWPTALLNAAMADSLSYLATEMDEATKGMDADSADYARAVDNVVRAAIKEHQGILFSGDGYDVELLTNLAKKENIYHLETSVDAFREFTSPKNVDVLQNMKILSHEEIVARQNVLNETFATEIGIEVNVSLRMVATAILPACYDDIQAESQATAHMKNTNLQIKRELVEGLLHAWDELNNAFEERESVEADTAQFGERDTVEAAQARYAQNVLRPKLDQMRDLVDDLERRVASKHWPYDSLQEIVSSHHT